MTFELLPILDLMLNYYEKIDTKDRFKEYLKILQGNTKGDIEISISGFNPMGKEHILVKLKELKKLNAERIIQDTLLEINTKWNTKLNNVNYKVVFNLLDDLKGGWTNHYTSDYESKFKINAFVKRKFCIPIFWSSENFSTQLIKERILEYVYRTIFCLVNLNPKTLEEHLEQERFVVQNINYENKFDANDVDKIILFYTKHKESENYNLIFNFFYGNEVAKSLEFPIYDLDSEMNGFDFAKYLENKGNQTKK